MSDELFESFGSDDLFEEEETENQPEGEGQNKIFIIAVAALGALLVISLILFGVWAFVINPRMQANMQPTETVVVIEETATEEVISGDEEATPGEDDAGENLSVAEESPTDTPEPTPTPVVGPTRTPTPEADASSDDESGEGGTGGETAKPTPTSEPRRTPTPSPTRRPVATPKPTERAPAGSSSESLSQTGLGEVLLIIGAIALIGVAFFARRLRSI